MTQNMFLDALHTLQLTTHNAFDERYNAFIFKVLALVNHILLLRRPITD